MRTLAPETKAKRRNANAVARYPLFAHAGLLDQIGVKADWNALQIQDDEFARAIQRDIQRAAQEQRNRRLHAVFIQMLDEAITEENREEVTADYDNRIERGGFASHALAQWSNRIDYLNGYIALYTKRTKLEVYEEAIRRMEAV